MNISHNQFGLTVAYLLPGFIGLAGIAPFAPIVAAWLLPLNQSQLSLGAPLYAILAATTIGMTASCFRWLVIDHIHHLSGLRPPLWDDSRLEERVGTFDYLVDNHYRYYQFYANTLIAVAITYPVNRLMQTSQVFGLGTDAAVLILCAVLFAGSRNALARYYERTERLIGRLIDEGGAAVTNGNHHEAGSTTSAAKPTTTKPAPKPTSTTKATDAKGAKASSLK